MFERNNEVIAINLEKIKSLEDDFYTLKREYVAFLAGMDTFLDHHQGFRSMGEVVRGEIDERICCQMRKTSEQMDLILNAIESQIAEYRVFVEQEDDKRPVSKFLQ